MPAKHTRKIYVDKGFYHIFNRGVEKRLIFLDKQDYSVFLKYLRLYLLPRDTLMSEIESDKRLSEEEKMKRLQQIVGLNNFHGRIEMLSFVLMPNHFHFLLRQFRKRSVDKFMKSIQLRYTMYFNKRHERVGSLYQGRYKAVLIEDDRYFLHLSRYVHLNPKDILKKGQHLKSYPYSSYPSFLGKNQIEWVYPERLLAYFRNHRDELGIKNYRAFVEGYRKEVREDKMQMSELVLDL